MAASRRRPFACIAAVLAFTTPVAEAAERVIESGTATWYGGRHVGLRTSSGEMFTGSELTAAHPYLPLGTHVRVTMADTGSSVIVKINDRQPAHGRRIIDLSHEAAARLGMLARGAAPVTVSAVTDSEPVEVAMAPEDGAPLGFEGVPVPFDEGLSAQPRGRPRMHHARRAAWAAPR